MDKIDHLRLLFADLNRCSQQVFETVVDLEVSPRTGAVACDDAADCLLSLHEGLVASVPGRQDQVFSSLELREDGSLRAWQLQADLKKVVDAAVRGETRRDKEGQGETRRDKERQGETRRDKERQGETRRDKERQGETRRDKERQG